MSAPVVSAVASRHIRICYTTLAPTCFPLQVSCGSAMEGGLVLPVPSGPGAAGRNWRQTSVRAPLSTCKRLAPLRSTERGSGRLVASCGATKPALFCLQQADLRVSTRCR
jgi:hypothetical protein